MLQKRGGWLDAATRDQFEHVDLRGAISAALTGPAIDEQAVRNGVWRYVDVARQSGRTPDEVLAALQSAVDDALVSPLPLHHATMRRVVRWCVEAYFGQLEGVAPEEPT